MPAWATNMVALPFGLSICKQAFARRIWEREHSARSGWHLAGQPSPATSLENFRDAPRRNLRLILRQLCVMRREDPTQNACIRVRAMPRRAAEEETKGERWRGLSAPI